MIAAVGCLALASSPAALADPIQLEPAADASFTARVGEIPFRATISPLTPVPPGRIDFYVSRNPSVDGTGVLSSPIDTFFASPDSSAPPVYGAGPDPDTNWPNKPGTYHWQAVYSNCAFADPNCFSPVRSLTIGSLEPPAHGSPAGGTTIPFGGERTFSVRDVPSYTRTGTHIYIEFSKDTELSLDGTFANRYLLARPTSVGGGIYRYQLAETINERPGTYYWIAERFDCSAEDDCYVTDGQVRSFTIAPPVSTPAPDTVFTNHPPRRTRKRWARFGFASDVPDASFRCYYTGGWRRCASPQKFRRLKPGRYRFKVRAVANGKPDPSPASWLFKVLRRHRGRH